MDKVIRPIVPQWERKQALENVSEDSTLHLAQQLMVALTTDLYPTVVQLAALRLVQKAVIGNYAEAMGATDAREMLSQATALAAQYSVRGSDGNTEF